MDTHPIYLGVNIDHIATLRQARGTPYPRPAEAVALVEQSGADSITVHLREDRRHIQDSDLVEIQKVMRTHMNLECAVTREMLTIAVVRVFRRFREDRWDEVRTLDDLHAPFSGYSDARG